MSKATLNFEPLLPTRNANPIDIAKDLWETPLTKEETIALFGALGLAFYFRKKGLETATKKKTFWVYGDTKPHKEELKAMGFKWSPQYKGWLIYFKDLGKAFEKMPSDVI